MIWKRYDNNHEDWNMLEKWWSTKNTFSACKLVCGYEVNNTTNFDILLTVHLNIFTLILTNLMH